VFYCGNFLIFFFYFFKITLLPTRIYRKRISTGNRSRGPWFARYHRKVLLRAMVAT